MSCLSTVPYDSMVKELRAAVPSIQSDFSRLQTVAKIGENLAQLWDQSELLGVFQTLQTNAKWWHTLVAHGVKIDPRTFQSSISAQREAAIRAVVPALLEKSNGNLSLAMDYCSQFDLEAYYASLCYIENTLKRPPCGIDAGSFDWADQIRTTAARVDEAMVMTTFRKLVTQIHAVDYEKVRFVCTWLLEVLCDNEEEECLGDREGSGCVEQYQQYLEVATFLSTLSCPTPICSIVPSLLPKYKLLPREYLTRLPLWGLIENPWALLEPLMLQLPEFATKLVPLCTLLDLDRDDFFIKRAKNYYAESLKSFAASNITSEVTPFPSFSSAIFSRHMSSHSTTSALGKEHPIHGVHEIISNVKSLSRRISVWQWIYDYEMAKSESVGVSHSSHSSDLAAVRALQAALEEITTSTSGKSGADEEGIIRPLQREITLELVKHNCLCSLRTLEEHHTGRHCKSTIDLLVRHVGNVDDLLRSLFTVTIEQAWLLQLRSLRSTQLVLSCSALLAHKHTPAVVDYLRVVQRVVADVYAFHSQLADSDLEPSVTSSSSPAKSQLEAIRHSYVGSLLTDVEFGQSGGDSERRDVMLRGESGAGEGLGTGSRTSGGVWSDVLGGTATGGDMRDIIASGAESRRREDVLRAFGISALVASTADEETR